LSEKAGFGKKYALVIPTFDKELIRTGRNLQNVKIIVANQLNILDLMKYDAMIVKDALPVIEKTYLPPTKQS
jgi:ribosomal protein L4